MTRIRHRPRTVLRPVTRPGCARCASPILVIEDQRSIGQFITTMIAEHYGYSTLHATTLAEAESMLAAQPIYLAISDLHLPDAPNGEIMDLLARRRVATIALTGELDEKLRATILQKGAIDYIPKQNVHSIEYAVEAAHRMFLHHHTKVLIVDDSVSSRSALRHILESLQFQVVCAADGEAALALMADHPELRLVLIDYAMPGMNGFELTQAIRRQRSKEDLAIIGISGVDSGKLSAMFLKSGANDFISKPYSHEELHCRIEQNLEMLDLIRSNRDAANLDFLTGLHNRRYFFEQGAALLERHKQGITAVMLDIDHFKQVNDRHGHDVGDLVLKSFAGRLALHFGKHLLARLGGEEFAVLIHGLPPTQVIALCEALRQDAAATPVAAAGKSVSYTVSIGVAAPGQVSDMDSLMKLADQYLYAAKSGGRNRIAAE